MSLERLSLTNYRNFEVQQWQPSAGVNLVVGANAQGKTNLLEAIALLSTGRIFRSAKDDSAAIRIGADSGEVLGQLSGSGTEIKVVLQRGVRKRAFLNSVSLAKNSDLLGRCPTVVFSNADLGIVREDAGERRRFLDQELSQLFPVYLKHFASYKRSLEQRNALLKQAHHHFDAASFEVWETQMGEHGEAMRVYRREFVEKLHLRASGIHQELGQGELLSIEVLEADSGDLTETLRAGRTRDIQRGSTQSGPHRDDLTIKVNEKLARSFGSQGQQRTAALAIKLATIDLIQSTLGEPPMILLDDVLSELDHRRREQLLEFVLATKTQTILTCTEADQAGESVMQRATIFSVHAGNVKPA